MPTAITALCGMPTLVHDGATQTLMWLRYVESGALTQWGSSGKTLIRESTAEAEMRGDRDQLY